MCRMLSFKLCECFRNLQHHCSPGSNIFMSFVLIWLTSKLIYESLCCICVWDEEKKYLYIRFSMQIVHVWIRFAERQKMFETQDVVLRKTVAGKMEPSESYLFTSHCLSYMDPPPTPHNLPPHPSPLFLNRSLPLWTLAGRWCVVLLVVYTGKPLRNILVTLTVCTEYFVLWQ